MSFCVYISCVGERDPFNPEGKKGPLLDGLCYLRQQGVNFNAVYLIPTSKEKNPQRHTEDRAEQCREHILQMLPQVQVEIKPLQVDNPADLSKVYPAMREILERIADDVRQKAQDNPVTFHINISPGTPQMGVSSLPFLVSFRYLPLRNTDKVQLWQVLDRRHYPGGDWVRPAPEPILLGHEKLLLQLERLAEKHLYQAMVELISSDGLMAAHFDVARRLCQVLTSYDQWRYKQTVNDLQDMLNRYKVPNFLQSWLNAVSKWLEVIAKVLPPKDLLAIDRYYCGCRRLVSGLYPDAISHFWTACELALEVHGEDKDINCPRGERESAWEFIRRLMSSTSPLNKRTIWVSGVPGLSENEPHPVLEAVDRLRVVRNAIEHGLEYGPSPRPVPVTQQLTESARQIAEAVLTTIGWERAMNDCPLRPDLVKGKLQELIHAMRESLWQP